MADGSTPSFLKPRPAPAFLKPPSFLRPVEPAAEAPVPEDYPPIFPLEDTEPPRSYDYSEASPAPPAVPGPLVSNPVTEGSRAFLSGYTQPLISGTYGVAAADVPFKPGPQNYRQQLHDFLTWSPEQQREFRLMLARDHSPTASIVQSMVSDLLDKSLLPEEIDAALGPEPVVTPMRQRPAFQRAREMEDWSERTFPVSPDYQEGLAGILTSLTRGLGTLAGSATAYTLGTPITGAISSILGGMGENVQEIYSRENVAQAEAFQRGQPGVQPGLSSPSMADLLAGQGADTMAGLSAPPIGETEMQRRVDEVLQARLDKGTGIAAIAGGTDLLPLMTLFEKLPGVKNVGAITKIIYQAGIEGGQEAVQQLLLNTAAGKALSSGLAESLGIGGGVGAISQTISELIGLATGRNRGQPLSRQQRQALAEQLAGRVQPSTGGRLDVEQPPPPPLPPLPPPAVEDTTAPTVQPLPGPAPSGVVPVTQQAVVDALKASEAAANAHPPGDPRRTAALENYLALANRFISEQQARPPTVLPVGPTPARPAGGEPGGMPPAAGPAPGPPATATQVLPTNLPPSAPGLSQSGVAAAPAPEVKPPVPPPAAEPPIPVPPPVEDGGTAPAGQTAPSAAPLPPAPPVVEPKPEPLAKVARVAPAVEPEETPTTRAILGPKPVEPGDILSVVRGAGGIKPTGNLLAQDADQYPGVLNNKGKTVHEIREILESEGYFGSPDPDAEASILDSEAEQMIIDAMGGQKIYPQTGQAQADVQTWEDYQARKSQLDEVAGDVDTAIKNSGRTDITNKERDLAISRAFSVGTTTEGEEASADAASEALDFILSQREEPEPAKVVPTEEETPFTPAPEGQLFMPGTERQEAQGQEYPAPDKLRKGLLADRAAIDAQTKTRYSITETGGEITLRIARPGQAPVTSTHTTLEQAASAAATHMGGKARIAAKKAQQGVGDLGMFGQAHTQTDIEQTDIEQAAPAPAPVAKAPEPAAGITDEAKAVVHKFDDEGKKTRAYESMATPDQVSMYNRVAKAIKDLGDRLTGAGVDLSRSGALKPMSQAANMDQARSGLSGAFSRYMNQVISTGRGYKNAAGPEKIEATRQELEGDLADIEEMLARPMEPIEQRAPAGPPKFDTLPASIDPADVVQVATVEEAKAALLAGKAVQMAGTTRAIHKLVPAPRGEGYALYKADGTSTLMSYVRDSSKAPWTRDQAAENAAKGMFVGVKPAPAPAPTAAEPAPEVTYRVASQEGRYVVLANEVPASKLFSSRGMATVHMRRLERGETGEGPLEERATGAAEEIEEIEEEEEDTLPVEAAEPEAASLGAATPTPRLWGDDPDLDAEIEANDEADLAINTLPDRVRRAGETPTFKDVSMVETTPMNAAAAWTDAGLSPEEAAIMSPEGRFQALATLFRNRFGFKTVSRIGTYGKANALQAIDAMMDGYRGIRAMMHILGLPQASVSLGGTLSFTLGRQTRRSAFLGVYNPDDQSIELVGRSNGFAHEWMHALDHWLMDNVFGPITGRGPTLASAFTRDQGLNPSVTLEDHFIQVMNVIFFDDAALAARVLDLQIKASKVNKTTGAPTQEALNAQRMLEDIAAGRSKLGIKQKSEYYKTSKNYGKGQDPYWTKPAELLARAFEAYVAWRVNIVDPTFPNNFMTKGEAAYLGNADARLAETFPHDPDRMRIFGALHVLMGAVATQTGLAGTPAAMPSANELIQDDVFYAHAAEQERQNRAKAKQRNLLNRLKNQLMLATSLSGWNELYDQAADSLGARFGAPKAILSTFQSLGTSLRGILFTEAAVANHLIERPQSKNAREYLFAIGSQLFELAPGRGDLTPETWTEGVIAFTRRYAGKLENILARHNIEETVPRNPRTQKAMADVGQRNRIYEILTTGNIPAGTSQDEVAAAAAIRQQIFDEIYRDAKRAGLDIGYLEDAPYLPVLPDPHAIHQDPDGFIEAATKLYQLVYDRAVGTLVGNMVHVDPVKLNDAINDLKKWNGTASGLGDPEIVRLRLEGSKLNAQIKDLQQSLPGADDPDLVRDMIDEAQGKLQAVLDELSTHIGPLWSETKAHRWHEAFIRGEYSAMDTLGPQTKHTKTRVLPSESQDIMAAFLVSDPIEATSIYINSMARKIEYSSRFGQQAAGNKDLEHLLNRPNSPLLAEMKAQGLDRNLPRDRITAIMTLTDPNRDNRLEMLFLEAQRAGAVTTDLKFLRGQVEYMTGRKSENAAIMRELSNVIYVAGSLALMPRAAWTSMTEPITTLARTGDFAVAGRTLSYYMKEFFAFNGTTVADVHDVAQAIGMIASETQEVMLQSTMGDIPMSSRLSKFMAAFYERIQLAPLTRMQTRTGVIGYHVWLKKLLRMALGTTGKRAAKGDAAVAKANLRELGIAERQIQPLWDFLAGRGIERIMSRADANTPMGQLWAVGQRRFAHSVVQQGTKATSTRLSAHPMGRLVMGLMRFAYTFTRNILIRPIRQATRDERLRIEAGENRHAAAARSFRDNLMYRMGIGFGALWLGHLLVGMVRSLLFDRENAERHIEEEDFFGWQAMIALSRSGAFGALDPLIQAWKGLRYQRDLTSVTSGAFLNVGLNWLQSLGNLQANNSPNTNTTERNFAQDTLRMYQTPLVMAFLNALPGGRAAGMLYGMAGMLASSNSVIGYETDWIAGEKRDTGPKGRAGRLDMRGRPSMR